MAAQRKGILLAGGHGTRLYPMTEVTSKHLLAVYDKPMIYYPLTTLMMAGVREVLIIALPRDIPNFQHLFGDGRQWGMQFEYKEQVEPRGLADAFLLGEKFLNGSPVVLVLGDNIFYADHLSHRLQEVNKRNEGGTIFAYKVKDPSRYGVVTFDQSGRAVHIEEKPKEPKSNYAIPGLYFFDETVVEIAKSIKSSARGELEITDVHNAYMQKNALHVEVLSRGVAWFDSGTPTSLLQTSFFIEALEERQGIKVGCPEEVALRMGFIDKEAYQACLKKIKSGSYRQYLEEILDEELA